MHLTQDEDTATGKKNTQEEITDDVDLFASAEGKDDQTEDREEEDLFAAAKSSGPLSNLGVKSFSIFSTDDKDDANDEDINSLFVPAGAEEGNTANVDVEDNSELLKWVSNVGCPVLCILVSVVVFFLPLIFIKTSLVKWLVVENLEDSVLCRVFT